MPLDLWLPYFFLPFAVQICVEFHKSDVRYNYIVIANNVLWVRGSSLLVVVAQFPPTVENGHKQENPVLPIHTC